MKVTPPPPRGDQTKTKPRPNRPPQGCVRRRDATSTGMRASNARIPVEVASKPAKWELKERRSNNESYSSPPPGGIKETRSNY